MTDDVYAPPQTEVEDREFEVSELEQLRRDYLGDERGARGLGVVVAGVSLIATALCGRLLSAGDALWFPSGSALLGTVVLAGAMAATAIGFGLMALQRVAFTGALLLCVATPPFLWVATRPRTSILATLLCAAFAWSLSRAPSRFVFSSAYRDAICATPELGRSPRDYVSAGSLLVGAAGISLVIAWPLFA